MPDRGPSLSNLTGRWRMNKALSDDIAPILELQGVSLLVRKAIAAAAVVLEVQQPSSESYTIKQHAVSAAAPGTTEEYHLDDQWRTNTDPFFGAVRGRSRWISLDDARKHDGLQGEWTEHDRLVLAEGGAADETWHAVRIWGFEHIDGNPRWTQRVKVSGKQGGEIRARMVYDLES